jgi:hypothetical protein
LKEVGTIKKQAVFNIKAKTQRKGISPGAICFMEVVAYYHIALLINESVAYIKLGISLVNKIIGDAKAFLYLFSEFQRIAAVVIGQSPIVKIRKCFIKIEIHCRRIILIGEYIVLFSIHPFTRRIERYVFSS